MQSHVFETQIFYVFRGAREVDPYDRAGYKSSKFPFRLILLSHKSKRKAVVHYRKG